MVSLVARILLYSCITLIVDLILKPVVSYGINEQLWLQVLHPDEVAYHFKILPAKDFGGVLKRPLRGLPILTASPWQACTKSMENSNYFMGRVVLVVRGECSFLTKALNVQAHGAAAVIVANNDEQDIDTWIDMSEDGTGRVKDVTIAAFYLLGKDGHKIKAALDRSQYGVGLVTLPSNVSDTSSIVQPKWDLWYN